jgi:uncharacterized protein Smg (DUF494 family)
MKDENLLEMLLTLFKETLTQLQETYVPEVPDELKTESQITDLQVASSSEKEKKKTLEMMWFRTADKQSIRVFTPEEQMKLTKASHQFLKRLGRLGVLSSDTMELIINRLLFSDSRFVNLQETKWTIRSTLADTLAPDQLAFLDLILYQKEDGLPLH